MRSALVAALCGLVGLFAFSTLAAEPESATEEAGPLAYVSVAGAPGDGEEALAAALSRQLAGRGLKPATAFQANVYEVQGTVRVAPAARGKQSVTIVWVVLGPDGNQLGVTRQTIGSIENEQYVPSACLAFILARKLGKPVDGLFYLEGDAP